MAELSKNEQIAKDFVAATLNNPNSTIKAQDTNGFAHSAVELYKTVLKLLEDENTKSGGKIEQRHYP